MEVERIPVSTIVKTGAKVAAAFIGSSVFCLVVFVVALFGQGSLAAAIYGPQSGSSAAALGMLIFPIAIVEAGISWAVMFLYLFALFERLESHADLGTAGRVTLACVGSLVASLVILLPIVAGPQYPLASSAVWSIAAISIFRRLKSLR